MLKQKRLCGKDEQPTISVKLNQETTTEITIDEGASVVVEFSYVADCRTLPKIGFSTDHISRMFKGNTLSFNSGKLYSPEHARKFDISEAKVKLFRIYFANIK